MNRARRPSARARGRRATSFLVVLTLALLVPAVEAGELSKEEGKWAKACLERLGAGSRPVREGAEQGLTALGTDAVPMLADAWWNAHEEADAARIEPVFSKIGGDASLRRLRRMRADARGAEARMLDALIAVLSDATSTADGEILSPDIHDAREGPKWAKACLERLGANSPRVRKGAEQALATLGLDAMPDLVDLWVKTRGRTERAAVKRVLLAIGREAVVKRLRPMREGARAAEARRLDELLSALGASSTPGSATRLPLAPSSSLDWRVVPFGVEHVVRERLPAALGLGRYAVRREGPVLVVDVDGDGTVETRLPHGEARTLRIQVRGGERPVLLYEKLGDWYACSASLLVGESGPAGRPVRVELLDGDLDGSFVGERDRLRVGDGAFLRYRKDGLVLWGEDRARYELVEEDGAFALHLEVLGGSGDVDKGVRAGLLALNRFRAAHGLPPLGHDPARTAACRQHAEYLATNVKRGRRKSVGGAAHEESPGWPGYSPEGAEAGARANIGSGANLARTVERLAGTLLHRTGWLCGAEVGVGLGAARKGGGWSVIWTGPAAADGDTPVLVPAPGARDVPRSGSPEWPPPDRAAEAYEQRVGYPVSVTFAPLELTGTDLVLTLADGATRVPGLVFTPAQPVADRFPHNAGSVFFLPSEPLARGASHWAVFTATRDGRPVRFAWTFVVD